MMHNNASYDYSCYEWNYYAYCCDYAYYCYNDVSAYSFCYDAYKLCKLLLWNKVLWWCILVHIITIVTMHIVINIMIVKHDIVMMHLMHMFINMVMMHIIMHIYVIVHIIVMMHINAYSYDYDAYDYA